MGRVSSPMLIQRDGAAREAGLSEPMNALARAAAAGDEASLEALLRVLAPALVGVVRAVLGPNHPDRDDALQDCLIALVNALPAFEGRSRIERYARRIAVRLCIDRRRRAQRRFARMAPEVELDGISVADAALEEMAEQRRETVRELLETLPDAQAETLALRVCLGMSLEEVAESTGVPVNTVRSRIRLARAALRARIERDPRLSDLLGSAS